MLLSTTGSTLLACMAFRSFADNVLPQSLVHGLMSTLVQHLGASSISGRMQSIPGSGL